MNRNEVIKQLKELREHCKYQATSGETIWDEDVQALNYAINELEETDQEVPVQEQHSININQLRIENGLEPILGGDVDLIL